MLADAYGIDSGGVDCAVEGDTRQLNWRVVVQFVRLWAQVLPVLVRMLRATWGECVQCIDCASWHAHCLALLVHTTAEGAKGEESRQ